LRDRELACVELHGGPKRLDLPDHLGIERGNARLRVELVEDVVEALRAEDQLERRTAGARVERHQALGDRFAAPDEIALRDSKLVPIRLDVTLNLGEPEIREVQKLVGTAEARIEPVHLVQHLLRLGALGGDRRGRARKGGRCAERRKRSDQHVRRRTTYSTNQRPQETNVMDAPVGPVQHECGRLAMCEDGCAGESPPN
jgi:hypothetical protein